MKKIGFPNTGNGAIVRVLTNPLYTGLVKVNATAKEPERLVKGIHKAIVSEEEYWLVQELLEVNKRDEKPQPKDEFPIKSLLFAHCCHGKVTAG